MATLDSPPVDDDAVDHDTATAWSDPHPATGGGVGGADAKDE